MPRGGKRWRRCHETGRSNRPRAIKIGDPADFGVFPQQEVFTPNELAETLSKTGLTRSVKVYSPPKVTRTRLGGIYFQSHQVCSSPSYTETVREVFDNHGSSTFVQSQWSNQQPRLGIPTWSDEPGRQKVFSTDGASAPSHQEKGGAEYIPPESRPPAGKPTPAVVQDF